ncbi:MAG TPA: aspartyl/asparaginyl beta-hydroxylase domain-containing protein [Solirubrobacteraceae bacterium]
MDPTARALISFLTTEGAAEHAHRGGRGLLEHLQGTYEIVARWNQPPQLQHAALIHSVYGTDLYRHPLLPVSRRAEVAAIAGEAAERLAYLFCATPREFLLAGTYRWVAGAAPALREPVAATDPVATRAELDALVLLHMANLAEQSRSADGSPGRWLVRLRELGEQLIDSEAVVLPLFLAGLAAFSEPDELLTLRAYRAGVSGAEDPAAPTSGLALSAATCPVVAEPCLWLAHVSHQRGELAEARNWARLGRRRLLALGTAWDRRLSFEQWLALSELLGREEERGSTAARGEIATDPRTLWAAVTAGEPASGPVVSGDDAAARGQSRTPAANTDRARFHRYVDSFADAGGEAVRTVYPDLASQPWFDPAMFPLAGYLESNYDAVREEILALEPARFHRESERIRRSGEWDVVFLYERGRRHDAVCAACPVTTRGIESHLSMRTVAGLSYVSRMRPGTHIQPHHGPTNLRLRCHLGITVPDGDCAIRVDDETRAWREGRCLVFDDHFEHEAWNRTDQDRLVLIVDLWHPGLSPTEVGLLEGLHAYAYAYARQLNRYWSANADAAAASARPPTRG